jgi:hypothetical protein
MNGLTAKGHIREAAMEALPEVGDANDACRSMVN